MIDPKTLATQIAEALDRQFVYEFGSSELSVADMLPTIERVLHAHQDAQPRNLEGAIIGFMRPRGNTDFGGR